MTDDAQIACREPISPEASMHPFRHIAELFHAAATHLECRQPIAAAPSSPFNGVPNQLAQLLQEMKKMSDAFSTEMDALRADVAAQSTVIASATAAFSGLAAQLAAAEAAAKNAGATQEQIAAVTAVRTSFESNTAALSAAIPANTPAAPEPTSATPPADTTPEPAPVTTVPAETDPAAPTGAETQL